MGKFDGTSITIESFLGRFERYSLYHNWNEKERMIHLESCLDKEACNVLWDGTAVHSSDTLITALRNRYGSTNQKERFKSELRARRRRKNETLQSVYQDIRRLMALAYAGETGSMAEDTAVTAFVDSFGDDVFASKVLEKE